MNLKTSVVISFGTIVGLLVGLGSYSTTLVKDREILKIEEAYSIKMIEYEEKISLLKIENEKLKNIIAEYEKKRKRK